MDETVDAVDRISDLPAFIIHHIMSYLYPEDAARTSLLSKRWNHMRTTFPILDFPYLPKLLVPRGLNDQNLNVWKERLLRNENFDIFPDELEFRTKIFPSILFPDATLLKFRELKLAMRMLTVAVRLMDVEGSSSLVDKWIGLAVENGVKELRFEVESPPHESAYTLPQAIYSAKLLTTLELTGCRLEEPLKAISLNSLKELILRGVYANEQIVHKLVGDCHLLEDLRLSGCLGLKCLSVSKEHKLKNLTVDESSWPSEHCELERVVVPSLQQLSFRCCRKKITVVCPILKKLVLDCVMLLKDEEFYQLISKFPLLEDLCMTECHTLERIKISSDRLKYLLFYGCDNLKAIDVDTPNLFSFTFGTTSINSIPTVSRNVQCPWIVDIIGFRHRCGLIDTLWFHRLKEFLGASKQIVNLFICIPISKNSLDKVEFNLEKARKHSPFLPIRVGSVQLEAKMPKAGYKMLLDGLFWICCPKTLGLHATIGTRRLLFVTWLLKWLFKKPWKNRNVNCCKSSPVKCWKHNLKQINIVRFLPRHPGGEPIKVDNLMVMLQEKDFTLPRGYYTLKLEWCVPVLHDTT